MNIDINKWKMPIDDNAFGKNKFIDMCRSPYHQPPSMLYIPPGSKHTHKCPSCGKETIMIGRGIYLN